MLLIDDIIEKILNVSSTSVFSCVTNGIYESDFLYTVIDKLKEAVEMNRIDIHFSFDLFHRFKDEETKQLVLNNIQAFQKRYNHTVVVQMILTEKIIEMCKKDEWSPNQFEDENKTILAFLYPHKINTGLILDDFQFKRKSLLWFLEWLKNHNIRCYNSFVSSCYHSANYKHMGRMHKELDGNIEQPGLTEDRSTLLECDHSLVYQCYSDSDNCIVCDILSFDE